MSTSNDWQGTATPTARYHLRDTAASSSGTRIGAVANCVVAENVTQVGLAAPVRPNIPDTPDVRTLAAEEDLWRALLPHLPETARLLQEALGGMRPFWRLLHNYGGQSLRVPSREPCAEHPLCQTLGVGAVRGLIAMFGGTSVYVPRCSSLLNRLRQHEIITAFSQSTSRGTSSVTAVAQLAKRYNLSDRRIWQILKKTPSLPPQGQMLRRLASVAKTPHTANSTYSPAPPNAPTVQNGTAVHVTTRSAR